MEALNDVIESTRQLTLFVEELVDHQERLCGQPVPRRRPKLHISEGQLRELLQSHFSVGLLLSFFHVQQTIYRRIHEFHPVRAMQSAVSDADLHKIVEAEGCKPFAKQLVEAFIHSHPTSGQRLLVGHLRSLGR